MKIALMTLGSTGDVFPFEILGKHLTQEGHDVTIFSQNFHQKRVQEASLKFVGYGDSENDFPLFNKMLDNVNATKNPVKKMHVLLDEMYLFRGEEHFSTFLEKTKGFDIGLVNMYDHISMEALIQNNIPWLTVDFCPALVPTKYDGPETVPSLGPLINPLLWKVTRWLFRSCDKKITEYLGSLGGTRVNINFMATFSPHGHIYSVSKHLAKFFPDLPDNHTVTGPWQPENNDLNHWQPHQELLDFVQVKEKPVVVSFGSMGGTEGDEITAKVIEAINISSTRAIIQRGYANLGSDLQNNTNKNIIFVDYVPHNYLFKHASMVVHHGGAGTTVAVCKAGAPSIVIPHLGDQPYWAQQLQRVGVSPAPIAQEKLNSKTLSKRITEVISNKKYADAASLLANAINQENGLSSATKTIEKAYRHAQ